MFNAMLLDRLCGFLGLFRGSGRFWAPIFYYLGHLCGAILDPLGILAQRQWKVLEIGGAPMMVRA